MMRLWKIKKRDADLERELQSDLDPEEEEQRENGVQGDEARSAARRAGFRKAKISQQILYACLSI